MRNPIKFECHACGQSIRASIHMSGKNSFCPSCGRAIEVPTSNVYVIEPQLQEPNRPDQPLATPVHTPENSSQEIIVAKPDYRSPRKREAKPTKVLWASLIGLTLVIVVLAIALTPWPDSKNGSEINQQGHGESDAISHIAVADEIRDVWEDLENTSDQNVYAYAQEKVKDILLAPKTAEFPDEPDQFKSVEEGEGRISWVIEGKVDSENRLGVPLRSSWKVVAHADLVAKKIWLEETWLNDEILALGPLSMVALRAFEDAFNNIPTKWEELIRWSGSGAKETETFYVSSKEWSVTWAVKNKSGFDGVFQISVYDEDGNLQNLAANIAEAEADDISYMHNGPGTFYLSINTGSDWAVSVGHQVPE